MHASLLIPVFIQHIIILVLGLCLGSFATALTHRIPRGLQWTYNTKGKKFTRSACASCNHVLTARDLVPLFSWLMTGGKCRHCHKPVSVSYPLIELSVLAACTLAYLVYGFTLETFFIMAATPFLVALFVIDLRTMLLPNQLVLAVAIIGALRLIWRAGFTEAGVDLQLLIDHGINVVLFAAISWVTGAVMTWVLKKDSLGFGDVKFFAMAGLWLPADKLGWYFIVSGIIGLFFAAWWKRCYKSDVFPFGPALILGFYILLLWEGSFLL